MKELKKFWFGLTPQQQLFVVVFVVVFAWICWTYIKSKKDLLKSQIKNKAEIDVLHGQGVKESYPLSRYQSMADKLYKYMDGPGTTTDSVVDVLNDLKNDADFIQLEKAFGLRRSSWSWGAFTDPSDLSDWLRSDLSEEVVNSINQQLSRKGLTKKF